MNFQKTRSKTRSGSGYGDGSRRGRGLHHHRCDPGLAAALRGHDKMPGAFHAERDGRAIGGNHFTRRVHDLRVNEQGVGTIGDQRLAERRGAETQGERFSGGAQDICGHHLPADIRNRLQFAGFISDWNKGEGRVVQMEAIAGIEEFSGI